MIEKIKRKKCKKEYDTLSITMELKKPLFTEEEENIKETENKAIKIDKKILKYIGVGIVILTIGVFGWLNKSYDYNQIATSALKSDEIVEVKINDYISFTPKNQDVNKGFIFYPGAKIEPSAYAPICRAVASKGYQVVIVDVPFNIAILGKDKGREVINDYPNITSWSVGGHSLGGVVASDFAVENNSIDSVILLASYPRNDDLKNMGKEVLSIWGSKDGVINFEKLIKAKEKLPDNTNYVEIEGANHSQFGDYGLQKGDNKSLISIEKQMNISYDNIVKFLDNIN